MRFPALFALGFTLATFNTVQTSAQTTPRENQSQAKSPSDPVPDTSLRRFEVGLQAGDLHLGEAPSFCSTGWCVTPQFTAGTGFTFNVNQHLAIDTSVSAMPQYDPFPYGSWSSGTAEGGYATTFFAGPKGTVRGRRWGLFAEARPGFLSWSHTVTSEALTDSTSYPIKLNYGRRTYFAIDMSGGVEYLASNRVHLRISMGSALVRYNDTVPQTDIAGKVYELCAGCRPWTTNLETNAGVYWDLGKPIAWTPDDIHQVPSHRFFDKTNFTVLTVSLLGQASDAITTQRFLKHGVSEADPLTRPFVSQGWPGQIGIGILDNAAQLSVMYALHRMNHHRIERIVPLLRGVAGGVMGYRNNRLE